MLDKHSLCLLVLCSFICVVVEARRVHQIIDDDSHEDEPTGSWNNGGSDTRIFINRGRVNNGGSDRDDDGNWNNGGFDNADDDVEDKPTGRWSNGGKDSQLFNELAEKLRDLEGRVSNRGSDRQHDGNWNNGGRDNDETAPFISRISNDGSDDRRSTGRVIQLLQV